MEHIKIIKHFNDLIDCEKFVITGSLALRYHGFETSVRDLDIVLVNPTKESVELLQKLREKNPTGKRFYPGEPMISFMFNDTQVDFFMQTKEDTELMWNGFYVAEIRSIIKAKKSYKRPKDWVQLLQLSRQIFNPQEFNQYLDGPGC